MESSFERAKETYQQVWGNSVFTNLSLLDAILATSGITWSEFVHDPGLLKERKEAITNEIDVADFASFDHLIQDGSGTCTTFAIAVAHNVFGYNDGMAIGDTGNHRAAYNSTGLVIDSAARRAMLLSEGETEHSAQKSWTMQGIGTERPKLSMAEPNQPTKDFEQLANYDIAVRRCLYQTVNMKKLKFIVLFRTRKAETLDFDGKIQWDPANRLLAWSWTNAETATRKTVTAIFGKGETTSQLEAEIHFRDFCRAPSCQANYWRVQLFVDKLWAESLKIGPPRIQYSEQQVESST